MVGMELESALLMVVIMIGFMNLLGDSCHLRAFPGGLKPLTRICFKVHLLAEQRCKSRSTPLPIHLTSGETLQFISCCLLSVAFRIFNVDS